MSSKQQRVSKWAVCMTASFLLSAVPLTIRAQESATPPSSSAPDNSAHNKNHSTTADQQKEGSSDRQITQKIRQAVMADKSLSTYAHNVKIITQNGSVTLKGPVHSDDEKEKIASAAASVVGSEKVTNQITVKQ
jgi:hyperosmotically inducible periplasmic protein